MAKEVIENKRSYDMRCAAHVLYYLPQWCWG